ncbi:hypothetical protein K458DRAFT_408000 [Lentithecium fluviatile CBS 122367]|uniref:Uncharacterized protein n=1 Tax=Lentithecium fluviatile CBS 122367 TaxID=1168545 RepID=A0A6G1IN21_9PLEO|nr:hypothetical protein K458DRAFT_408000 [Lentithecium fluviatile CBS 122367]
MTERKALAKTTTECLSHLQSRRPLPEEGSTKGSGKHGQRTNKQEHYRLKTLDLTLYLSAASVSTPNKMARLMDDPDGKAFSFLNKFLHDLHSELIRDGYGAVLAQIPDWRYFKFIPQDSHSPLVARMGVGHAGPNRFRVGPDGSSYRVGRNSNIENIEVPKTYPSYLKIKEPFNWDEVVKLGLRAPMEHTTLTVVRYYCFCWTNENRSSCNPAKLYYLFYTDMFDVLHVLRNTPMFRQRRARHLNRVLPLKALAYEEDAIRTTKTLFGPLRPRGRPTRRDWLPEFTRTRPLAAPNTVVIRNREHEARRTVQPA